MSARVNEQPMLFDGPALRPSWPFGDLEPSSYDVLMIDPPWLFDLYSIKGAAKSPQAQYRCLTDEEIAALPFGELAAPDCLVWLWSTWPKLPFCLSVLANWGFSYKTGGAWDKVRMGPGYLIRSQCEPFLLATKGAPDVVGKSTRNLLRETRREHSRKPECAYAALEAMTPGGRRLDVFSRASRDGWDAWGDEVGTFDVKPTKGVA